MKGWLSRSGLKQVPGTAPPCGRPRGHQDRFAAVSGS